MAETTRLEGGADAGWHLPIKYLPPPLGSRDLPDPLPLRKIVGASVIILATALGSGELILWPYIVTQVGIGILWLAAVGFTMQFFLNMEIERYTLATGETAVAGFTRFWKPWGIIFILTFHFLAVKGERGGVVGFLRS
jgi:hypothetical protein